jgi:hypothetical protein
LALILEDNDDQTKKPTPISELCTLANDVEVFETVCVATVVLGLTVSTVIDTAADVAEFPAVSVSTTTMLHKPSVNVPSVQLPDEIVQVTSLDPAFVARILPVPVIDPAYEIVGVLSFVMLSEFDSPESDDVARSGSGVGVGTTSLLITTFVRALEAADVTPLEV